MSYEGRLARTDVVISADITNVTEVVQNSEITADTVRRPSKDIIL